jgi:hypothetical protein
MYKLFKDVVSGKINTVLRLSDNTYIPFDLDNTDYQAFKSDIANGAELQDAEGKVMTKEQVQTFLGGLK